MFHPSLIIVPLAILGKGAVVLGKGAVAVHHLIAAHAAEAVLIPGGTVIAVMYVDHEILKKWYRENPPGTSIDRSVKFAIGGNLVNGEFRTITSGAPSVILQGFRDNDNGEIIRHRILRPRRMEPNLADSLVDGKMLVFA